MSKIADVSFNANVILISGDLDFDNVVTVYQKIVPALSTHQTLIFNFERVTSSNSAGIALIVELMKQAKRQNKPIQFQSLSDDIHSLAAAADLDTLINCLN